MKKTDDKVQENRQETLWNRSELKTKYTEKIKQAGYGSLLYKIIAEI